MKKLISAMILLSIVLLAGNATAIKFELGSGSDITGSAFSDPGLVMQYALNPYLDSIEFYLNTVGDFNTFYFATFWTNEDAVNPDDLLPQTIEAKLDIQTPPSAGQVPGTSVGTKSLLGLLQGWKITWNDPVFVSFSGGIYSIELSDAEFESYFGPDGTRRNPGQRAVFATVTLTSLSVPEPGTLSLLGAGLLGLLGPLFRRHRRG